MKAILIDPGEKSVEYVELTGPGEHLPELHRLVGDDCIDIAKPFGGLREMVIVGDHSALHEPALPHFKVAGYHWPLHGKAVVLGFNQVGATKPTKMTLEEVLEWIEFE